MKALRNKLKNIKVKLESESERAAVLQEQLNQTDTELSQAMDGYDEAMAEAHSALGKAMINSDEKARQVAHEQIAWLSTRQSELTQQSKALKYLLTETQSDIKALCQEQTVFEADYYQSAYADASKDMQKKLHEVMVLWKLASKAGKNMPLDHFVINGAGLTPHGQYGGGRYLSVESTLAERHSPYDK